MKSFQLLLPLRIKLLLSHFFLDQNGHGIIDDDGTIEVLLNIKRFNWQFWVRSLTQCLPGDTIVNV